MQDKELTNYLAHKALLYAATGDRKRSEALRKFLITQSRNKNVKHSNETFLTTTN